MNSLSDLIDCSFWKRRGETDGSLGVFSIQILQHWGWKFTGRLSTRFYSYSVKYPLSYRTSQTKGRKLEHQLNGMQVTQTVATKKFTSWLEEQIPEEEQYPQPPLALPAEQELRSLTNDF